RAAGGGGGVRVGSGGSGGGRGGMAGGGGGGWAAVGEVDGGGQEGQSRLCWDAVQRRMVGGVQDAVGFVELAEVDKGGSEREQRLGVAGIGGDAGAVARGVTQQPERFADLAVVPGVER